MSKTSSPDQAIIGVWKLVDARTIAVETGVTRSAYGDTATGFIHYSDTGRMMALITHGGRENLDGDRQSCPDDQKARAFTTSISYAGTYSIKGDRVIHHVEASSYQNWVGTDLIRIFRTDGNKVTLETVPQPQNGVISVLELEWERCS